MNHRRGRSRADVRADAAGIVSYEALEARCLLTGSPGAVLWSEYLGGTLADEVTYAATDASGNVIVCGNTNSGDFRGASNPSHSGTDDDSEAFLAKLDKTGKLLWAKYLGGLGAQIAKAVAVDMDDNITVVGTTTAYPDLPVDGPFAADAYVAKFDPDGNVTWSTRLGGSGYDSGIGLAVDAGGNALVVGKTESRDMRGAVNEFNGGAYDGFVAEVGPNGQVLWTAYLGSSGTDSVDSIAVDPSGHAYVCGWAPSDTLNGIALGAGARGGFVAALGNRGAVQWAERIAVPGTVWPTSLAVAPTGEVFLGASQSPQEVSDVVNGVVLGYAPTGRPLWSTFISGNGRTTLGQIAYRSDGSLVAVGSTVATDLPLAVNDASGDTDALVASLSRGGTLQRIAYVGGIYHDEGAAIAVGKAGDVFIAGSADSPTLPNQLNGPLGRYRDDAFVSLLHLPEPDRGLVTGTSDADQIRVGAVGTGQVVVTVNGQSGPAFTPDGLLTIYGLAGNDRIEADPGVTIPILIYGGDGSDTILGGTGADTIYGNTGNDSIMAGGGADSVMAGLGNDTLYGGSMADTLLGGNGTDLIGGGGGNDYIEGRGKADTIRGGAGNDTIWGGAGNNVIYGGAGDDWIDAAPAGAAFVNRVDGGMGHDTVRADAQDLLAGVETPILV